MLEEVRIEKLVHGGQALATLQDGRRVFVWNALPGEIVKIRILKGKKRYGEAIAEEIVEASDERIAPRDAAYLSTSPWQVMSFSAENRYKKDILLETYEREKVRMPELTFFSDDAAWQYRNKMEYSFWGDDDGLHLALFHRGTHGKQIVEGSSIARPEIDETANKICAVLNQKGIRASQLKSIMIRCDSIGNVVAALFVRDESFAEIGELKEICQGISVCYSNPKSPASVLTKELYTYGSVEMVDDVLGTPITYNVHSFFQVNLPVFIAALQQMRQHILPDETVVDFYSGVGTIGVPLNATYLVESDQHNISMAGRNTTGSKVIHATAEQATEYITSGTTLIVDPPRAGLNSSVTDAIIEKHPDKILYLSCNPITHARDLALLQNDYDITWLGGYNFFPRTPHIESLAVLQLKS